MSDLISTGSRVLDVGCGSGGFGAFLAAKRGCSVLGIEPSPERAEHARERGLDVRTGLFDAETVAGAGTFDVVLFADVLEHLPNPASALQLAAAHLNPGGAVVASVPNVAHWTVRIDLLRGNFRYQSVGIMDATHLRWFTQETVKQVFRAAGLEPTVLNVSAGKWLWDYDRRLPWRWVPKRTRDQWVTRCVRWWPRLFGCQHIVRAERVAS